MQRSQKLAAKRYGVMTRLPNPIPDPLRDPLRGPISSEERFLRYKKDLHQQLIAGMDLSAIGTMNEEELRLEVRRAAEELCRHSSDLLNLSERERLVNEVLDETFGLGPLEPLMRDPTITDILINGPKTVYVERKGRLERADIAFNDDRHLLQIVQRIVGRVGRRVDETSPMVDARLPDGSRVNAIIPPLALDGALVSIRRFGARPLLIDDLMAKKAITQEMVDVPRGLRQGPGQHPDLRRHRQRQDDAAQRPVGLHPARRARGHASRTPPSCGCSSRTSSGWRPGRPTSRGTARSRPATWSATPCGCGPTGSSSASAAAPRPSTCSRP